MLWLLVALMLFHLSIILKRTKNIRMNNFKTRKAPGPDLPVMVNLFANFPVILMTFFLMASCSKDDEIPSPINDTYLSIPDIHFESKLIELGIDSDGTVNHQILKSDAEKVTRLDLNLSSRPGKISDLTGIEGFINITFLSAEIQEIQDIDLSFNTELDTLFLGGNLLASIDVSKNPDLILLDVQGNYLHTINGLSGAENLKKLNLSFNNFEELSLDNGSVEVLLMSHNLLQSIDINGAISLKNVLLTSNQLSSIDLSTNTLLETLVISDNQLTNIHLEQNGYLTHFYISSNSLTDLDVSYNQALIDLRVDRNPDLSCIKIQSNQEIPTLSLSEYQQVNELCD